MKTLTLSIIVAVVFGFDVVAAQQTPPDPREYLGCYALFVGPWEPALPIGADTIYLTPPTLVELTDRTQRGSRGGWEIRPLMRENPRLRFASWSRVGDEIRMIWSNGFSGLRVVVAQRGDSFVGEAESFWDFGRKPQHADVEALPVECPENGASSGAASPNVRVPPSALRASAASRNRRGDTVARG